MFFFVVVVVESQDSAKKNRSIYKFEKKSLFYPINYSRKINEALVNILNIARANDDDKEAEISDE